MSLDPFSFLAQRVAMGTKTAQSNFLPYGATKRSTVGEESSHTVGELHVLDPSAMHGSSESSQLKDGACLQGKLSGVVATLQQLLAHPNADGILDALIFQRSTSTSSFSGGSTALEPHHLAERDRLRKKFGKIAVCLDIDGVVIRGKNPIAGAPEAYLLLRRLGIPVLFLTNASGQLEGTKAKRLNQLLFQHGGPDGQQPGHRHTVEDEEEAFLEQGDDNGAGGGFQLRNPITASQVIMSHTPMRSICASEFADRQVLLVGPPSVLDVAADYGLRRAVLISDLQSKYPQLVPNRWLSRQRPPTNGDLKDFPKFDAIFILDESTDALNDIQMIIDIVCSPNGKLSDETVQTPQSIPIFLCADDLYWPTEYGVPRLDGCGCFREMLNHAYECLTGRHLFFNVFGKPRKVTADCALKQLHLLKQGSKKGSSGSAGEFDVVYMVGDNLDTDIRLANAAGAPWRSVHVSTGIGKCPTAHRTVALEDVEGKTLLNDPEFAQPHEEHYSLGHFVLSLLQST